MSLPGKIIDILMEKYPEQSTEVALRYLPLVRILRGAGVRKVLEVGSGDLGITPYSHDFELTGLDRSFERENPAMDQVVGTAARLPFEDHSFDAVISVDSLEHIPPDSRESVLSEMLRTASGMVVIAVPSGAGAEAQDRILDERYSRVRGEDYPFFRDHLENGLPGSEDVQMMINKLLRRLGRSGRITIYKNANLRLRTFLMKGWISRNKFFYNFTVLGLMPMAGLLSRFNYGNCYRVIMVVDLD
ncbi:MAG: class I SAM-dependent methyltransferase [Thermoleophilia bacterium]|jgi:SAM-dependent methyltransferase